MDKHSKDIERQPGFFTIDVEDYYHIIGVSGTPPVKSWDNIPSRVDKGLRALFELLDRHQTKATLFFLGYVARRHPELVREALSLGHELASHGMYHREVRLQEQDEFYLDATESKKLLEDIGGVEVIGWRSAGFSINRSTPWFFEKLIEAGYKYDSSIVPNRMSHNSLLNAEPAPFPIHTDNGKILEFPIGVADLPGSKISMFGGGYLRFFPKGLIKQMAEATLAKRPLLIYIHPRELDPRHPRIEMNALRKFKSYINMSSVPDKLDTLLNLTDYTTLGAYYARYGN